ncbi:MAG: aspartate--tRNA ligase [Eubacteriales bacterium]
MPEFLSASDKRTKYCGEFNKSDVGNEVCVMGWVQRQRDLGSLIFIDLRDRTGIVQLAFDSETDRTIFDAAFATRSEFTICAHGVVRNRGEGAINANIPTGEIEIAVHEYKILGTALTPPFEIVEDSSVKNELRLKYRYLDLRRPDMQRNIKARCDITKLTRDFFYDNGFMDIETPNLIKPTPEGARDYLVPSRLHPGKFYALPQSPQLYKQLLMIAGFDRYMQIARCFRDEDLRADRQPEFTQIDVEMSFAKQDDIIGIIEQYLKYIFKNFKGMDISLPLQRMTYAEAMDRFGSDKPDLRFGLEIIDLTETVRGCAFKVFAGALENGGSVRAIKVPGGAKFSRKEIDSLTDYVKTYRAKGLAWMKNSGGEVSSSFAKFMTEDEMAKISAATEFGEGDLVLICADRDQVVFDSLGALRCEVARRMGLIKKGEYKLLWITEFPLLEYSEEEGRFMAKHHPFTMPFEEDLQYIKSDPARVRSIAYDIVINGMEAGGGSVRINNPEIQEQMFEVLGMTPEVADEKFGFLIDAYKYGAPPHAGMAFGLDRLVTLLLGLDDIRDVIAFPKVQNASELMSGCPNFTDSKALDDLSIAVTRKEDDSDKE